MEPISKVVGRDGRFTSGPPIQPQNIPIVDERIEALEALAARVHSVGLAFLLDKRGEVIETFDERQCLMRDGFNARQTAVIRLMPGVVGLALSTRYLAIVEGITKNEEHALPAGLALRPHSDDRMTVRIFNVPPAMVGMTVRKALLGAWTVTFGKRFIDLTKYSLCLPASATPIPQAPESIVNALVASKESL